MRFQEVLKAATAEHGSIAAMSRATGIPGPSIRKYLQGAEPSFARVVLIADYLGVSLDYLAGRTDNPRPRNIDDPVERLIADCYDRLRSESDELVAKSLANEPKQHA